MKLTDLTIRKTPEGYEVIAKNKILRRLKNLQLLKIYLSDSVVQERSYNRSDSDPIICIETGEIFNNPFEIRKKYHMGTAPVINDCKGVYSKRKNSRKYHFRKLEDYLNG